MELDDVDLLDAAASVEAFAGAAGGLGPEPEDALAPRVAADPGDLDALDLDRIGDLAEAHPEVPADIGVCDVEQLEVLALRRQPPVPQRLAWRSSEAMSHARKALDEKRAAARAQKLQQRAQHMEGQLDLVATDFPDIARAVGIKRSASRAFSSSETSPTSRAMSFSRASSLIRAAFAQNVPRGLGIKHERLIAFSADLVITMQQKHLQLVLQKLAYFRQSSSASEQHCVIIAYSHESDGTCQQLAQHVLQQVGRPSAQRLPTEVVNQQGTFRIRLARLCKHSGEILDSVMITEPWQCASCVVLEKTSLFILAALERRMPFRLAGSSHALEAWAGALAAASDYTIIDQHSDKGSNNLPAIRHLATTFSEAMPSSLQDVSVCELHVIHNVKASSPHVKFDVGKMYSMRNICRVGSFHQALVKVITHMCHVSVRRLPEPPPEPKEQSDIQRLIAALFDLESDHHRRSGSRQSFLKTDLQALGDLPLYEMPGQVASSSLRIHYCFDAETGRACCSSEDETQEKATTAHVNFFCSTAFGDVALSRFTNVGKARKRILLGMCNQRLYLSAIAFAATKAVNADDPEHSVVAKICAINPDELGSGTSDLQLTHRARCRRMLDWMQSRRFYYNIAISEISESWLELLQYKIFGRDRTHIDLLSMCCPEESPIGVCLRGLTGLLQSWSLDKSGPWRVLALTGWTDFGSADVRLAARASTLHVAAGILVHFDRKYSEFPFSLLQLLRGDVPHGTKADLCQRLLRSRPCDVPLFAREFVAQFNSVELMMSPMATMVLQMWAAGKRFSTKASECGHATERRMLASTGGPGKSLVHHCRKHILHKVRLAHVERHGLDPLSVVPLKGKLALSSSPADVVRGRRVAPLAPDHFARFLPQGLLSELDADPSEASIQALEDIAAVGFMPRMPQLAALPAPAAATAALEDVPPLPATSSAALVIRGGEARANASSENRKSGSGLNPYLVHLNRCRKETKLGIGSRAMTQEEQAAVVEQARQSWQAMGDEEKGAIQSVFDAGVRRRRRGEPRVAAGGGAAAEVKSYQPSWRIVTPSSAIAEGRFCEAAAANSPEKHFLASRDVSPDLKNATAFQIQNVSLVFRNSFV